VAPYRYRKVSFLCGLDAIPIGSNPPHEVNVVVEVPLGGDPIKYELDKASGTLFVDRFLYTRRCAIREIMGSSHIRCPMVADPGDVLIAQTTPVAPGVVMAVRPIGVLRMTD